VSGREAALLALGMIIAGCGAPAPAVHDAFPDCWGDRYDFAFHDDKAWDAVGTGNETAWGPGVALDANLAGGPGATVIQLVWHPDGRAPFGDFLQPPARYVLWWSDGGANVEATYQGHAQEAAVAADVAAFRQRIQLEPDEQAVATFVASQNVAFRPGPEAAASDGSRIALGPATSTSTFSAKWREVVDVVPLLDGVWDRPDHDVRKHVSADLGVVVTYPYKAFRHYPDDVLVWLMVASSGAVTGYVIGPAGFEARDSSLAATLGELGIQPPLHPWQGSVSRDLRCNLRDGSRLPGTL
jgi:hypothetical protein